MPDVKIKGFSGAELPFSDVPKVWLAAQESTEDNPILVPFTYGEALEGVEVTPDFSGGDMQVTVPEGYLLRSGVVKKPENLIPGNIKKGETIAGIPGEYEGETVELEDVTVDLAMADGDQVIEPSEGKALSKVTLTKPETLVPENIAEGVDIAGVQGIFAGGGGLDILQVAQCAIPEIDSEKVTTVAAYAFYGNTQLSKVNAPNLTEIGNYGFAECASLTEVNSPKLAKISQCSFSNCNSLKTIDVSNVRSVGASAFYGCKNLEILDFGTSLDSQIGSNAFSTGGPVGVIIRNTTMIPDAAGSYGYLFGSTKQRLYVPRSMVTTWQNSNYMKSYHKNLVVAIEDYPEICG